MPCALARVAPKMVCGAYPADGMVGRGVASMVDGDLGRHLVVIVVATAHEALATSVARLAAGSEVELARCDDVYMAAAELALMRSPCILVVGRLCELAKEGGRFFAIAARNEARCCALVDAESPVKRHVVLAAMRAGVSVVGTLDEINGVFDAWLAGGGCHSSDAVVCLDEEYRATEAELNALLGQESDE